MYTMIVDKVKNWSKYAPIIIFVLFCLFNIQSTLFPDPHQPSSSPSSSPYSSPRSETLKNLHTLTKNCIKLTNSYCIKTKIIPQPYSINTNILNIELLDLKNWILYARNYTSSDIGVDIHRKMELKDVQGVLLRGRGVCGEYVFGEVERLGAEWLFKIEEQGVITVYEEVRTKQNKETVESRLHLIKQHQLSDIQIFTIKLQHQKYILESQLSSKISEITQQNKFLRKRIERLQNNEKITQDNNKQLQDKQFNEDEDEGEGKQIGSSMRNSKFGADRVRKPKQTKIHVQI